ncbi:MAG: hypothetical protein A3K60_04055 [Euryarchaeota archaeon RBG_19FT_COMBO_56_21]|nr:MAG: hypothetical protein A3K60_04055 [Euryarchaeota archaeon RBG_19FT_COMBO_56_21]
MADGDVAEFQRKIIFAFFALLLIAGIVVYWIWGLVHDTWNPFTDRGNIGIYTIYVPLIAFGVIGILLYRKKPVKA